VLADAAEGFKYDHGVKRTPRRRIKEHIARHQSTEPALLIERAVDVKCDETDAVPAGKPVARRCSH
jgi:hypothetical protein